jgi:hypothetical protein
MRDDVVLEMWVEGNRIRLATSRLITILDFEKSSFRSIEGVCRLQFSVVRDVSEWRE